MRAGRTPSLCRSTILVRTVRGRFCSHGPTTFRPFRQVWYFFCRWFELVTSASVGPSAFGGFEQVLYPDHPQLEGSDFYSDSYRGYIAFFDAVFRRFKQVLQTHQPSLGVCWTVSASCHRIDHLLSRDVCAFLSIQWITCFKRV